MGVLEGKVAIVTGAGQGLGRAEALALAAEGAAVIVNDMSDRAESVTAEIVAAGGRAAANRDDVSSWVGAEKLVRAAVDGFGRLDILMCNAGIVRDRMLWNLSEAEWDDVVRVHLKGHFAPTHFAARHWREESKRTGAPVNARIIYTTSDAGLYGNIGQANYSAAKAGIVGLCFDAAKELERLGVTVNAISPRGRTPMTMGAFGETKPVAEGVFDLWAPENVAPWIVYLASDHAARITGQIFAVYGGTVRRYEPSTVLAEIEQDARWTVAGLIDAAEQLVPGLEAGAPPLPDVGIPE